MSPFSFHKVPCGTCLFVDTLQAVSICNRANLFQSPILLPYTAERDLPENPAEHNHGLKGAGMYAYAKGMVVVPTMMPSTVGISRLLVTS